MKNFTAAAIKAFLGALGALALAMSTASAEVVPFPRNFRVQDIQVEGAVIHVRVGGKGPAVVMLHGFGDTGDMWAPAAAALVQDHTVIVPDLRGMGLSSHPEGGYDKKTQAHDIAEVLDKLKIDKAALVTHDIGNMVGYAFAAQFPARVTRWVVIDAPLPGIGPWDEIIRRSAVLAFQFPRSRCRAAGQGPRTHLSRPLLERNFRQSEGDRRGDAAALRARSMRGPARCIRPSSNSRRSRRTRSTTRPSRPRASSACRFWRSAADHSFGTQMADDMRFVASDVTAGIIKDSGHWIMEEQPKQTTAAIVDFIDKN